MSNYVAHYLLLNKSARSLTWLQGTWFRPPLRIELRKPCCHVGRQSRNTRGAAYDLQTCRLYTSDPRHRSRHRHQGQKVSTVDPCESLYRFCARFMFHVRMVRGSGLFGALVAGLALIGSQLGNNDHGKLCCAVLLPLYRYTVSPGY
jgi:hypothetical protein